MDLRLCRLPALLYVQCSCKLQVSGVAAVDLAAMCQADVKETARSAEDHEIFRLRNEARVHRSH